MNARMPSTGKPKFIMVGIDRPDGTVRLYASRNLPTDLGWGQTEHRSGPTYWHIDADMDRVLIIDAKTWGEAFMRAFEIWDNHDHPAHVLDTATGQVTELPEHVREFVERKASHGMRGGRILDGPANLRELTSDQGLDYHRPDSRDEGDSQ